MKKLLKMGLIIPMAIALAFVTLPAAAAGDNERSQELNQDLNRDLNGDKASNAGARSGRDESVDQEESTADGQTADVDNERDRSLRSLSERRGRQASRTNTLIAAGSDKGKGGSSNDEGMDDEDEVDDEQVTITNP